MTNEGLKIGLKIVTVIAILIIICEGVLAFKVLRKQRVSISILEDISKDVSKSDLLKKQDLNEINLEELYIEE